MSANMNDLKWFDKIWNGSYHVSHTELFNKQPPQFKNKFMTAAIPWLMSIGRERLSC